MGHAAEDTLPTEAAYQRLERMIARAVAEASAEYGETMEDLLLAWDKDGAFDEAEVMGFEVLRTFVLVSRPGRLA